MDSESRACRWILELYKLGSPAFVKSDAAAPAVADPREASVNLMEGIANAG